QPPRRLRAAIAQSSMRRSDVIEGMNQVIVDVDDQDRALKLWTEAIGFELVQDSPHPGTGRWIEVQTRDEATILVLPVREGTRARAREDRPTSNIFFYCEDLARTYAEGRAESSSLNRLSTRAGAGGRCSRTRRETGSRSARGSPRDQPREGRAWRHRVPTS